MLDRCDNELTPVAAPTIRTWKLRRKSMRKGKRKTRIQCTGYAEFLCPNTRVLRCWLHVLPRASKSIFPAPENRDARNMVFNAAGNMVFPALCLTQRRKYGFLWPLSFPALEICFFTALKAREYREAKVHFLGPKRSQISDTLSSIFTFLSAVISSRISLSE